MKRICSRPAFARTFLLCTAIGFGPGCGSPGSIGSPGPASGGTGGGGGNTAGTTGGGGTGGLTITVTLEDAASGGAGGAIDGGLPGIVIDGGQPIQSCGSTIITPEREQVDIFIVLDRSGSMYYSIAEDCYCAPSIGGGTTSPLCASSVNCTNRWDAVSSALSLTMGTVTTINWGLEMYSTPNAATSCTVTGTPQVPFGATNSAAAVQSAILRGAPAGNTPTAAAITAAAAYVPTVTDGLKKAILLATDGAPNCKDGQLNTFDDMPATLQAIGAAYALGIPVYVIGIGPSVGNLDSMAAAGGTVTYYAATSPQQLADALAKISKIVATTCTFQTPMAPPDDSRVYVYVEKKLIAGDSSNGWMFGATDSTIVLTGTYCQDMLAGNTTDVQVIFGCKDEPPPPVIP
jgi:hypothetical protein